MRVGILSIMHESNTLLPTPTTLEHFRQWHLLMGEELLGVHANSHHEIAGFLQGLKAANIEIVPLMAAWAMPGGTIEGATFDELVDRAIGALDTAGKLDGLLVAPHGAGVAENAADMDGQWLSIVRERIGPDLPMISTLDPHANLSPRMVTACDAIIAYRSNPHLDQRDRGLEAAGLMARTLAGEIRPVVAASFPPMAINIERQLTSGSPCKELYTLADKQLQTPGVLSNSVILGFPYADCHEMGSSLVCVADGDERLAQRMADELGKYLWAHRQEFVGQLLTIEEAVRQAATGPGPVGLLDMGDNVGGGSPADSTELMHAAIRAGISKALICLYDPAAAEQATKAGIGQKIRLSVGGRTDPTTGKPIEGLMTVVSLHDGKFSESQARHGGQTQYDMGPTAVVRLEGGQTILISSRRMAPFSLGQLTGSGLNPADYQAIIIKGVHAPVAAYAPVCARLIRVDTPGVSRADMTKLNFAHRRKPLFPFETDIRWPSTLQAG